MRKFKRGRPPKFLKENWVEWGNNFKNRRALDKGCSFEWPTIKGKRINKALEVHLEKQTQGHCSYCDHFPVREHEDSIDHFKPKGIKEFHHMVCQWENLYYSCENCQRVKSSKYDDKLLRPDSRDYEFNKYFIYQLVGHVISPNPAATIENQERALFTIETLDLNSIKSKRLRGLHWRIYQDKKPHEHIDDFAFRFIFD